MDFPKHFQGNTAFRPVLFRKVRISWSYERTGRVWISFFLQGCTCTLAFEKLKKLKNSRQNHRQKDQPGLGYADPRGFIGVHLKTLQVKIYLEINFSQG